MKNLQRPIASEFPCSKNNESVSPQKELKIHDVIRYQSAFCNKLAKIEAKLDLLKMQAELDLLKMQAKDL